MYIAELELWNRMDVYIIDTISDSNIRNSMINIVRQGQLNLTNLINFFAVNGLIEINKGR